MEIRIENTIYPKQIELLKKELDKFFNVDFSVAIDGSHIYFRDN